MKFCTCRRILDIYSQGVLNILPTSSWRRSESLIRLDSTKDSLYGLKRKIMRIARFCTPSSSLERYTGGLSWKTGHAYSVIRRMQVQKKWTSAITPMKVRAEAKKKGVRGRGRGEEKTLALKPHDSGKLPLIFHGSVHLQIDSSSK